MNPEARAGLYFCPSDDDPLFAAGAAWLGRDPASGAPARQPAFAGIEDITAEARGYGFHATLKPPMRFAAGTSWFGLLAALDGLAGEIPPFDLPPLAVADLHGFLALRETAACPPLQALADACVVRLDRFRAPPTEAELARRRRATLTPRQDALLAMYGYPYVLDTWFFHMTLTRRLTAEEHLVWRPRAEAYFADALARPRRVTDICVFTQSGPGAPFVIAERVALRG
jgi:Protein of unknown function (DUF1045)